MLRIIRTFQHPCDPGLIPLESSFKILGSIFKASPTRECEEWRGGGGKYCLLIYDLYEDVPLDRV